MRNFVQFALKVLRWFHIDVYEILKNHSERLMWRRALPDDGVLDEKGICIAVPLRAFNSVGQVGHGPYGHIGHSSYSWEKLNRIAKLKACR